MADLLEKKKQTQQANKRETQVVDSEIEAYRQLQEQIKSEETCSAEMKAELELLMLKRAKVRSASNVVVG